MILVELSSKKEVHIMESQNNKSKFVIINEKNNILNSKKNIKSWIIKITKFKYIIRFWKSKFK